MNATRKQREQLLEQTQQGDLADVQRLLQTVETGDHYALESALDAAAQNDHLELDTALHYVVERGRSLDNARLLLEAEADVNARDPFGYTPLHDSVLGNNPEIIQLLLDAGADPATRVKRGIHHDHTALEIARIERQPAPGGIPSQYDLFRRVPLRQQPAIGRQRILQRHMPMLTR